MDNPTVVSAYAGAPAIQSIPTNIATQGVMSSAHFASDCFVNQRFSIYLQAYMVSYVNNAASNYSTYGV